MTNARHFLAPLLAGLLAASAVMAAPPAGDQSNQADKAQGPLSPAPGDLSLAQRSLLHCSASFALLDQARRTGDGRALAWPDIGERGREFFVRAMARLMDELALDREGAASLVRAEALILSRDGRWQEEMPGCLMMLEGSGL